MLAITIVLIGEQDPRASRASARALAWTTLMTPAIDSAELAELLAAIRAVGRRHGAIERLQRRLSRIGHGSAAMFLDPPYGR